jgi:hypothetical protein
MVDVVFQLRDFEHRGQYLKALIVVQIRRFLFCFETYS